MLEVLRYIRDEQLLRPGERVAVACSGGADSVALLHILAELREELGIISRQPTFIIKFAALRLIQTSVLWKSWPRGFN